MRVSSDLLAPYTAEFRPDIDRVLAAILFLMQIRPKITQYQLVKSVFLADKQHLNSFGRPITYDKYVAMEQGPVPSLTYALLMDAQLFYMIYGKQTPWGIAPKGNRGALQFTAGEP